MHKFEGIVLIIVSINVKGGWVLVQTDQINYNYTSHCAKPELFLEAPYLTTSLPTVEDDSDQPKKKRKKTPSSQLADQARHESISEAITKGHSFGKEILLQLNKEKVVTSIEEKQEEIDFVGWAKLANVVNSFNGVYFIMLF
jgi:hypothetical protein